MNKGSYYRAAAHARIFQGSVERARQNRLNEAIAQARNRAPFSAANKSSHKVTVVFTAWPTLYSRLVCWVTRSKYAHVHIKDEATGIMAEVSAAKPVHLFTDMRTDWLRKAEVPLDLTYEEHAEVWGFIAKQLGRKYDWWGVLWAALGSDRNRAPTRWYCSNLLWSALFSGEPKPRNITPQKLLDMARVPARVVPR